MDPNKVKLIAIMFLGGIGIWTIAGINIWQAVRRKRNPQELPTLAKSTKIAWGLSMSAILIPYVAPIALIIGAFAFRKAKLKNNIVANKIGLMLTLLNCVWAFTATAFILTYVINLLKTT